MSKAKRERSLADNEAKAVARMLRVSPQKLNLVAAMIRGKKASSALADVRQDAALMLHDEHRDPDDVAAYLSRWLLVDAARARQMLRFLSSPLWRAYTSTSASGFLRRKRSRSRFKLGCHKLDSLIVRGEFGRR